MCSRGRCHPAQVHGHRLTRVARLVACRCDDTCRTPPGRYGAAMPATRETTFTLDRSVVSVGRLHDDDSQVDYWLAQPPEQRLAALEFLRATCHPDAYASPRLRGFLEVTQRT